MYYNHPSQVAGSDVAGIETHLQRDVLIESIKEAALHIEGSFRSVSVSNASGSIVNIDTGEYCALTAEHYVITLLGYFS